MSALAPGTEVAVPETTVYRPIACRVTRLPDNDIVIEFELPGKIVAIMMPEDKRELIKALTGGIEMPTGPIGV